MLSVAHCVDREGNFNQLEIHSITQSTDQSLVRVDRLAAIGELASSRHILPDDSASTIVVGRVTDSIVTIAGDCNGVNNDSR